MTADIKALQTLLPDIEKQEGQWPDELLGRFLCAAHGVPFKCVGRMGNGIFVTRSGTEPLDPQADVYSNSRRHRCPDTDLTAADKLCGELLPGWDRTSTRSDAYCFGELRTSTRSLDSARGNHPTSEPTAICIALARALIAEGEG